MFRAILILGLLVHSIITFYACSKEGILSPFPPFTSLATYQIFSDLVMALSLVLFFLFQETKKHGLSKSHFVFCAIFTGLLGSFSPLIYILLKKELFKPQS